MSSFLMPGFVVRRSVRTLSTLALISIMLLTAVGGAMGQGTKPQSQTSLSNAQRLEVMRSKLEALRRSVDNALAGVNAKDSGDNSKSPDDPRERLRALNKEIGSVLSEVSDLRGKEDRSDKYDPSKLDSLETTVTELNTRVEQGLQATASSRVTDATAGSQSKKKGGRRFFGLLPGKSDDKYSELTGSVAPGRDRVLFLEATREVRKGNHETGRLLFTTIITTYPDSVYLAMAKLAIADSFYLEGTTSSLIQAGQAYQDWLTFFPTDALADDAMLKVAETEMRQMGLADRDISHARKTEQRLKALLQQFPQTKLRPEVETRMREVQDNLAMHNLQIARFYLDARYRNHKGGLKGGQDRLKEILEKYPNFCQKDEVLFRYANTFLEEEEPDEAAKLYQQLVRDYPNSEYIKQAKEQLNVIGAQIPEADPIKSSLPPCQKPSFMQNMMQEISGSANVTTGRDGILISKKGEGTDLIDQAIANNGQIPETVQPVINRSAPARQVAPANQQPVSQPDDKKKAGASIPPNSTQPATAQPKP